MQPNQPRFFISYARSDGLSWARKVRKELKTRFNETAPWHDIEQLSGNESWQAQVIAALEKTEYLIVIATPAAMESEPVQWEWNKARELGVCTYFVLPAPAFHYLPNWLQKIIRFVLPVGETQHPDFETMPRCMAKQNFYNFKYKEPKKRFYADLEASCQMPRVAFTVPPLPSDLSFVKRPQETQEIVDNLLATGEEKGEAVAITAALRGTGGYGKTTLAQYICHKRDDIKAHFCDGILWVELKEEPGSPVAKLNGLIRYLKPNEPEQTDINLAKARLGQLLDKRDVLLVVDDVWQDKHLWPFTDLGPTVTLLVTTRYDDTLPRNARTTNVDAMQLDEAVELLATGLDAPPDNQPALQKLAERLGKWPQALRVVNGILRDDIENFEFPLAQTIANFNEELDEMGITQLDPEQINPVLESSLKRLSAEDRARFMELAIFPEDTDIPLMTVEQLWGATAGLSEARVKRTLRHIRKLSLFWEINGQYVRLHDIIRTYLREKKADQLVGWHNTFLDSYGRDRWADLPEDEPYLWAHLATHLLESGREDELRQTVLDGHYLARKSFYQRPPSVQSDLDKVVKTFSDDKTLALLQRSYRQMAHILARCETVEEVLHTLYVRLQHLDTLTPVWEPLRTNLSKPHILPKNRLPDLPHPALKRTLVGHTGWVKAVAISPDGKTIVSASSDHTLKMWDEANGQEIRTLSGHMAPVNALAISPDGTTIVSAAGSWTDGEDTTLKVWNMVTGQEICTLVGHETPVEAVAFSSSGRTVVSISYIGILKVWDLHSEQAVITTSTNHEGQASDVAISPDRTFIVSASLDRTLKVWNTANGQERQTLIGHTGPVSSAVISPDSKTIVSASWDGTIRIWDAANGQEHQRLTGHAERVTGVAISSSGKTIVSSSEDGTLKVWDRVSGRELQTLTGHTEPVSGVAISPDETFIVSASWDMTLKIWDTITVEKHPILTAHMKSVSETETILDWWSTLPSVKIIGKQVWDVAISPDGKTAVSAAWDKTLKVWDVTTGQERHILSGHTHHVSGVTIGSGGKTIVSSSLDGTLKQWNVVTGQEIHTLASHIGQLWDVAISPDEKTVVSAALANTLKVWDVATGQERHTLTGHTHQVRAVTISPDGSFIVSASFDHTLKLWDVASGEETRTITGHTEPINAVAINSNGTFIVSASYEGILKVWDAATGQEIRTLTGHTDDVSGVDISPDGETIVSASWDETLKLWDIASGTCLHTFYADAPLTCCAWSPDGETIVAGSSAGGVYFLRVVR